MPIVHGDIPQYMEHISKNIRRLDRATYARYPIILAQFDIVLCAVNPDDGFNSGKSAVKALECMAVGAVPICSRFGPYTDLYDAGAPVVIVEENSRDAWYDAMAKIIRYTDRREWLSNAGPTWVRENRDMTHTGHKLWTSFYKGLVV